MYEPSNDYEKKENSSIPSESSGSADGPVADSGDSFDASSVSDTVAKHVERELEKREPITLDDEEHTAYSDAGYILSDEAPTTPRRYYTPPEKQERPPKPPRDEKKKNGIFGKVAAGLAAGLLMGAAIGIGVAGIVDQPAEALATAPSAASSTPEAAPTPVLNVSTDSSGEMSATDIYALATQQVVGIRTEISYNIWGRQTTTTVSGTGFIVSEDGYIITNEHVIEDAYQGGYDVQVITYSGDTYTAEIIGFEDEGSDIAVLKIDATGLTPVKIGNSGDLQVGGQIYAVGNPLGELTYTMTGGMVSALDREISTVDQSTGETNTVNMFQIDAAVNGGNSGGPVYNSRGEVVGVVSAKYEDTGVEGLGFAIPINDAVDIANDLITQGYVSGKPYMGVTVQTMPQNVRNYYGVPAGAYVYYIESGSCADDAGLELGDIITGIDGTEITSSSDLSSAIKSYRAGDTAELTVYRDGGYITLSIVFDEERPSATDVSSESSYPEYFYGILPSANGM